MVPLSALDNRSNTDSHKVFSKALLSWNWLLCMLLKVSNYLQGLSFFCLFFLRNSEKSFTNVFDVWLTPQNSSGLTEVPRLGHLQSNSTRLLKMKGVGFRQVKHTTLSAHGTSGLPSLPVSLWQLTVVKATCVSFYTLLISSADRAV